MSKTDLSYVFPRVLLAALIVSGIEEILLVWLICTHC